MTTESLTLLSDYRPSAFTISTIHLNVYLDPLATKVVNAMQIERVDKSDLNIPLILDGSGCVLKDITIDGKQLASSQYQVVDEQLTITQFPKQGTLTITTEIAPLHNTRLEGLYMSNGRFFTQCEAQGFRCITYYLDRPDVLAQFTTTVHGNRKQYPYLLSNGNCIAQGVDVATDSHWHTWENPFPMPSYLFALVAGQFSLIEDHFQTQSGRRIALRIFVEPRNQHKCHHALNALKLAMRWDEENYGREYDLDVYNICAVDDFNSGAMENKGLNIFNSECVLADEQTATDYDFELIEAVVGHEYFHNWTGNRVTCRDWFQLCLKEGLTMFREQQFMESVSLPVQQRIATVRALRTRQFAEDEGPMAHPVRPSQYQEIRNFYTFTVYNKGAEIYRMLRYLVGPENFRKGMDAYFTKFDGQAVTIDVFVKNMQEATGKDLSQFHLWYNQAGTPNVTVKSHYDDNKKTLSLHCTQVIKPTPDQPNKKPLQIPFLFGALDSQGKDIVLQSSESKQAHATQTSKILELTQTEQTFEFINIPTKPTLSLLRGFSAPVRVHYPYSTAELCFLWQYDSDDFNRWDAGQRYLCEMIFRLMDLAKANKPWEIDAAVLVVLKSFLENTTLNPALIAELMTLPSESYLETQQNPVAIEALILVRDTLKRHISKSLQPLLLARYHASRASKQEPRKYARQLQNLCLEYLLADPTEEHIALCAQQYDNADNMTDRLAALRLLTHCDHPERERTLADFYQTYQDDPIVVNKWLSCQTQSTLPQTLSAVKKLMQHPSFSLKNPNKVRALIGAFCQNNLRHFHQADGSGYIFLADCVLQLDPLNSQIAARLVTPLIHWQRFDKQRSLAMKAQLQRLKSSPGLSPDVTEIVTKALA